MRAISSTGFAGLRTGSQAPLVGLVGVLGGCADLGFAAAYWLPQGVAPIRIPQSIAGWVLGSEAAIAGGPATAVLGIALYCYLTTLMVTLYVLMARRHAVLLRRPLLAGALYGVAMYPLLFKAIVPLWTGVPAPAEPLEFTLACFAAFIFFIGIPSALCARLDSETRN
jgi:hypothetical protein